MFMAQYPRRTGALAPVLPTVAAALAVLTGSAVPVRAQIDAGYLAAAADLRTTSSYSRAERRSERTLSLVPASAQGAPGISLVLSASFSGRTPENDAAVTVVMRAHYAAQSDERVRAAEARATSHRLTLEVDSNTPRGVTLRFFPSTWGYGGFVPPGDAIPVAYFTLSAADLRALALARTVAGSVLWTDFHLSEPELAAIKTFAAEVLPPPARR